MAKKNKAKINIAVRSTKATLLPVIASNGLPSYIHYSDSLTHKFRVFFEAPKSESEVYDTKYPKKSFFRSGKYSKSNNSGFWIFQDGIKLVGEDIAKTFAQLVIKKMTQKELSASSVLGIHSAISNLFTFISSLNSPPRSFSELSLLHFSHWLNSYSKPSSAKSDRGHIKQLLKIHPHAKSLQLGTIRIQEAKTTVASFNEVDFDKLTDGNDYSDKELLQILAYVFYEIEQAEQRLYIIEKIHPNDLVGDFIPLCNLNTKNPIIPKLLEIGDSGHEKLLQNIYIYIQNERNGLPRLTKIPDYRYFINRIRAISSIIHKKEDTYYNDFTKFLHAKSWQLSLRSKGLGAPKYFEYLTLNSDHHEIAILLYCLITTGLNLETILSWKNVVNNKPWYDIFDVELGDNINTPQRDKSVLLVGKKSKGIGASKSINTPIKVNSPIYKYLKLLDKTRPAKRKFIFGITEIHSKMSAFSAHYSILDDYGNILPSIETRRLRKIYAGHKLIALLKDVNSADELITKLKEALNHNDFDTTLFSYILKSGVGSLVINSAIVALTSDMIEKAMVFKGQIKEDRERSNDTHKVFLCDCTDPSNPSHDLPIADRCRKYDMCLGCERSEVYSDHLPAICYRIMQYEENRNNNIGEFNALLADRLNIAYDTLEQFKIRHVNGVVIVEDSYRVANIAMANNTPLLPPIIQTGAI